jgi:small-conductance mechanosensitive channel
MLANYSHAGLKTVWDGIDFTITYDSNASKAAAIAKEIVKKYSKGYTDITRKQLNKLRKSYHLKNTNVEPRIYTFIEPYGVKISAWYMTNAFATLTLRSTISMEILERIAAESDIELAYPTQALYVNKNIPAPTAPPQESSADADPRDFV